MILKLGIVIRFFYSMSSFSCILYCVLYLQMLRHNEMYEHDTPIASWLSIKKANVNNFTSLFVLCFLQLLASYCASLLKSIIHLSR